MIVFGSLILIIIIMLLLCSMGKIEKEKFVYKVFILLLFLILLIISGCRGLKVGTDTTMFVRVFKNINSLWDVFHLYNGRFEIGYLLFNYIIKSFFNSPHSLLFFSSFVSLLLFFVFFKKESSNPIFSIFLFVSLLYFTSSMCLLRQFIAIALCCIGIIHLCEKQTFKFLFFVLIAFMFHTSSIITLILWPLSKLDITPYNKKKFIIISFILVLFSSRLIVIFFNHFSHYSGYLSSDKYYLQNKVGTILKCMLQFLFFIFININYKNDETENSNFNKIGYLCALLSAFISLAAIQGSIISRMATYFSVVNCVTLPNMISNLTKSKDRLLVSFILITISLLYYFIILIFRPYWSGVIPYVFWG